MEFWEGPMDGIVLQVPFDMREFQFLRTVAIAYDAEKEEVRLKPIGIIRYRQANWQSADGQMRRVMRWCPDEKGAHEEDAC